LIYLHVCVHKHEHLFKQMCIWHDLLQMLHHFWLTDFLAHYWSICDWSAWLYCI